jgi:riboflavin kinase/FMN adenylyltransferase
LQEKREILKNCSTLKSDITSIAIGGFDGMHLAHQELFKQLDSNGAIVVIETGYANLTPKTYRAKYTTYPLFYYPLENIKHLQASEFINILQEEYPKLKKIVVGFDFKFGSNASGTTDTLKELFEGEVVIVDEFTHNNEAIHSRVIRNLLSTGDIPKATTFLNKRYEIEGSAIQGQGLGKKQFVATINISCDEFLIPCEGIYATYTTVNSQKYLSATFIGHRVTTDGKYAIETHIIDEEIEDINSHIQIEFIKKIRDNKKFEVYKDLQNQILDDISNIKNNFK